MDHRWTRTLVVSAALMGAITIARIIVANPVEAVGYLYVIPISLVAADRGRVAGLVAALAAFGLTVVWAIAQDVGLGLIGYTSRGITLAAVGLVVGWQAEQRRSLEREREALITQLADQALVDQLTGLPNRRAWDARLDEELRRARRTGRPLTVAASDVDDFKVVNDTHGHDHGDSVLRGCARAWSSAVRETDFAARLGGDEFFVLLADCGLAEAEEVANRFAAAFPGDDCCSVGLALWDGSESARALVRRADQALYAAKRSGRGQIALA